MKHVVIMAEFNFTLIEKNSLANNKYALEEQLNVKLVLPCHMRVLISNSKLTHCRFSPYLWSTSLIKNGG